MSGKTLLVDGHVHIYPNFNLSLALAMANANLKQLHTINNGHHEIIKILLLTERSDCAFFKQALESVPKINGLSICHGDEKETLILEDSNKSVLYLLAGRQIITREGLEVNALATNLSLKDRDYTVAETVERIADAGGVAVLNWAPGKWFLSRGKIVQRIIETQSPGTLLIGDTSMRPTIWPTPKLMKLARNNGYKIIAGSDPLPFAGEENNIGTYGFAMTGPVNPQKPAESLRTLVLDPKIKLTLVGKRSGSFKFIKRQIRIMTEKPGRK